jgi:hypothetical protein
MHGVNGKNDQPRLVLTIEGPEVKSGRIRVQHLAKILEAFQKSLRLVTTQLLRDRPEKVARQKSALTQELSTLEVVALKAGSFSVTLGLVTPTIPSSIPDGERLGHAAMKTIVDSLHLIEAEKGSELEYRSMIQHLVPFARMAPLFDKGVEHIRVHFSGKTDSTAVLNQFVCESIEELSRKKARQASSAAEPTVARPEGTIEKLTADELLHSALIGMWRNRNEMSDSGRFAREIRERAQIRKK